MNYTLNQLQIFLKIVETQSVTKASEELHLTQPAVSIQLKNFQEQFDFPLTEVVGRKLYITEFGHEVAQEAAQVMDHVYAINSKTHAFKGRLTGRIKISVVSTGKYVMPFLLSDFFLQNPAVELVMDVTNKSRVIESLEKNEVDLALVSILPKSPVVENMDLLDNKLHLVGNIVDPPKRKVVFDEFLAEKPLIYRENGSGTRQMMEAFIEKNNVMVNKKMELTSNEAVKQALLAGLGYSIMPLIGIRNELNNGELKIIPVKGLPMITTWSLIWLKGKKHSPVAEALIKHLDLNKDAIIHKHFSWHEML